MLKQHQLAKKRHQKKLKRKHKQYDPGKFMRFMMAKQAEMNAKQLQTNDSTVFVDK